jgi:hypothetical protein
MVEAAARDGHLAACGSMVRQATGMTAPVSRSWDLLGFKAKIIAFT